MEQPNGLWHVTWRGINDDRSVISLHLLNKYPFIMLLLLPFYKITVTDDFSWLSALIYHSHRMLPVYPVQQPPSSVYSGVCWRRWLESVENRCICGQACLRMSIRLILVVKKVWKSTFSLSGAWSNKVSKASRSTWKNTSMY